MGKTHTVLLSASNFFTAFITEINLDHEDFAYEAAIRVMICTGRSSPITNLASDSWSDEYFLPSHSCNPSSEVITEINQVNIYWVGGRESTYDSEMW
jgi:hypothetical protein